jgi:hypothetical protein
VQAHCRRGTLQTAALTLAGDGVEHEAQQAGCVHLFCWGLLG